MNVHGKFRRQQTKQAGQAPDWKKAIVTLKQGDKIVLT
jgi:ribosomal protein L23